MIVRPGKADLTEEEFLNFWVQVEVQLQRPGGGCSTGTPIFGAFVRRAGSELWATKVSRTGARRLWSLINVPALRLGEFGKILVEVDHDFRAILVLPAYRLLGPGSPSPANCSQ